MSETRIKRITHYHKNARVNLFYKYLLNSHSFKITHEFVDINSDISLVDHVYLLSKRGIFSLWSEWFCCSSSDSGWKMRSFHHYVLEKCHKMTVSFLTGIFNKVEIIQINFKKILFKGFKWWTITGSTFRWNVVCHYNCRNYPVKQEYSKWAMYIMQVWSLPFRQENSIASENSPWQC